MLYAFVITVHFLFLGDSARSKLPSGDVDSEVSLAILYYTAN